MKNKMNRLIFVFLIALLGSPIFCNAQKLVFSYDAAGNQERREWICVSCRGNNSIVKILADIPKEDIMLLKEKEKEMSGDQQKSYFLTASPNPVKEDLKVQWTTPEDVSVKTIAVFSVNGAKLFENSPILAEQYTNLSFINLPAGIYLLVATYSNGKRETLKIVKP